MRQLCFGSSQRCHPGSSCSSSNVAGVLLDVHHESLLLLLLCACALLCCGQLTLQISLPILGVTLQQLCVELSCQWLTT
jgi:hypothetical protein